MKLRNWTVRHAGTGKLIGFVREADIDSALALARRVNHRDVTVDDLPPRPSELAAI